jgi:putative membrane protein
MVAVAVVFGLVAGVFHVGFWVVESLLWRRPGVWKLFGARSQEDADTMAFGMLNQGFYNLFLGVGAIVGSFVVMGDTEGRTILLGYCCLFMLGAAIVLFGARRSMVRGALIQGLAPAISLVALAFI